MNIKIIRFTDWDVEARFEDRDGTQIIRRFYVDRRGGYVFEDRGGAGDEQVSNTLTGRGPMMMCSPDQDLGELIKKAAARYLRT